MIKELANSLHFTEIKGRREPKTDDKEAYLFGKFYEKNGFEQNPDNAYFRYDMKNYAHTPCDQN